MKINEGKIDRIVRVVAGVILLVLGIAVVPAGALAWVLSILGAILAVTGLVGFCPLYTLFKINTNK